MKTLLTTEEAIKTMSLTEIKNAIAEFTEIVSESATELARVVVSGQYGLADLHRGIIAVNMDFINKLQNQQDDLVFLEKERLMAS
jgi:hypothetical protein